MSKREQILILNPASEIKFKGPYTEVVTRSLELKNPSEQRVVFKIKTTTPKRYCVRPNSGTLNPGEATTVSIMLQPYDLEGDKTKHKFMVQSIILNNSNLDTSIDSYWKTAGSDMLMDTKLKCVFEEDDSPKGTSNRSSGGTGDIDAIIKPEAVNSTSSTMYQAVSSHASSGLQQEMAKSSPDQAKLWQEIHELKSENERLKNDGIRMRNMALGTSFTSATKLNTSSSVPRHGREPDEPVSEYKKIAVMVLMVLIGIFLGKMLF